jgi:predicted Holliday junction resolvase-like endonuclease
MNIKRILLSILLLFLVSLFVPKTAQAFDLRDAFTSENSVITKIQEGFEYFFAFKVESKIAVLERQAEKRLVLAQSYLNEKNNQKLQNVMQDYLQIKERQNELLGKTTDEDVLGAVENKTIEQQKTMEEIKTKINEVGKQNVVKIQEQVVNQVAEKVVANNGTEGATEFLNKVEHVWAPGTGPGGGESGVIYEGGGKLMFAPGTSAGSGNATSDIKTVEVKTGGAVNEPPPVPEGSNYAPGTSGDSPGNTTGGSGSNTIDPGTVDSGNTPDSETWIDP